MLTNNFNKVVLSIVVTIVLSANAGSFDDFFIAIRNDNAGTVNELLARGFDPNTRNEKGQPGLTIAMQEQSLKAAKALLAQPGIDVNALNQAGESALMLAALKGEVVGVQLLLERGARLNAEAPNGSTPLMMAAQYGSEDSVKLLLAAGADVKRRNGRGMTAADFARLSGREGLTKQLEALQR